MNDELPFVLAEPLRTYAGDTRSFPMVFSDDSETPTDLTGLSFKAQWRPSRSSDVFVDLTVEETDPAIGLITLIVSGEASRAVVSTANTDSVRGVWDVEGDSGEEQITFITGSLIVTRDVTRG